MVYISLDNRKSIHLLITYKLDRDCEFSASEGAGGAEAENQRDMYVTNVFDKVSSSS